MGLALEKNSHLESAAQQLEEFYKLSSGIHMFHFIHQNSCQYFLQL